MKIQQICFNAFQQNCLIAYDESGECVIVDPGFYTEEERDRLYGLVSSKGLKPVKILLTHGHFDHIYGVSECAAHYGVPVLMSAAERVILENNGHFCRAFGLKLPDASFAGAGAGCCAAPVLREIEDADVVEWGGGRRWEVIATPGHTPGGVCYLDRDAGVLVSGDTLFAGSIGRTDNAWGDYDLLMKDIFERLMVLDGDIAVIPGHGPQTTIADERMTNPFLMPFNEPYEE